MRYSHLLHLRWWGIGEGYIFETRCLPATVDTRRQMTRFQPYWPRQTATNLRRKVGLPFQLGEYFARGTHFRSANRQWSTEASKIQRNEHDRYAPVRLRKPAELSSIRWVSDSLKTEWQCCESAYTCQGTLSSPFQGAFLPKDSVSAPSSYVLPTPSKSAGKTSTTYHRHARHRRETDLRFLVVHIWLKMLK